MPYISQWTCTAHHRPHAMLYWFLYFFLVLGAKLLLAVVTIFLLLPSERSCNQCDSETLLIQLRGWSRALGALFLGRLERRWCPRCEWEGFARARDRRPLVLRVQGGSVAERSQR